MGIVDEDIVRVRQAVNIADIVSQYTQLRRVGLRMVGRCPFHTEKTGSFSVNVAEGFYYCFGCHRGGDAITFVREKEGLDFQTAVERLAAKANIPLRYTTTNEGEDRKRQARLIDAVDKAVHFYHELLLTSDEGKEARKYLRSRGFDGDVVRRYQLGWAPSGWDRLARTLRLSDKDWKDSGLGYLNNRGGQTDFFRERLLFPIFNERGDPVAFGGRIMPGHEGAKYKNTSDDAAIYSKSKVLYGLNWAKTEAAHEGEVIVCEGYTDVIGFHLAGVERAVATCGTALTEDHVRLLRKYSTRIVLAFDADAAGRGATDRVYEWEAKHGVEFAVVNLPPGSDPGELARTDPAALAQAARDAMPMLGYRVGRVLDSSPLRTPEQRARIAEAAVAAVREHPSQLVRDQYLMLIADRCRLDIAQLRSMAQGQARGIVVKTDRPVVEDDGAVTAEDVALTMLAHNRDVALPQLRRELFAHPLRGHAFELLAESADLTAAIELAQREEPAAASLLYRLAVEEPPDDFDSVIADLARYGARRALSALKADAGHAATLDEVKQYAPVIDWLQHRLAELDSPESRGSAVEALLAWLTQHAGHEDEGG